MFKMLCFIAIFAVLGLPACLGSNNVYNLNERDFEGYIRDKDIMLVDFFAPWCHHCQELGPELDAAADHLATKNQFVFAKVDCVNDGKQLCQRFNVQGYPTIKLFKYGQYVGDYVGQRDRSSLMQYVDSVASTMSQHAPLTSGAPQPLAQAQAVNYKPQAQVFPSHHGPAIHAPAPAVAPTFTNQANMHATNPSLMASFYGSSAHAQHPASATAAFLGNTPPVQQASPDSLQAKFGNMASLDIYRSKLKMIAAYKNYQRRLKEYRIKLTSSKAAVHPSPQGYAGAVTQPPRPGVNAFAQHQPYRGYYRPEALAAQNVQINRAYPQPQVQAGYPNQFASPYGYQALASSPYYRSKTAHGKRRHGKQRKPASRSGAAAARKAAYNRQKAAYYYKQKQQQQRQQQKQQQKFRQQQQRQQPLGQAPQQQFRQEPQQQQQQLQPEQQQFQQEQQQEPQQQQLQQQPHNEQQNFKQQQEYKRPQVPQALDTPALPIPAQSSNSPAKPDTSALKDLKADIESAIQDALRNAVSKGSEKTKPSPSVHVDGERAKPQATVAAPEQAGSGSGVQSPSHSTHGSVSVEDAVTGEDGSGSGLKPDSP